MCPLLPQQIRTPHSLTFHILTSCRTKFVCSGRADYPPRSKLTRHHVGAYGNSLDCSAPGISSHSEQELPRPSESCYVPRNGVIYMVSRNPNTRSGSIVSTLVQNNPKDEREDIEVRRPHPPGTSASLWGERHSKRTPEYRRGGRFQRPAKMFGREFWRPTEIVRTGTDLPVKSQILFGRASKISKIA